MRRRRDELGELGVRDGTLRDRENVDVEGARWIFEKRVAGGDHHDIRLRGNGPWARVDGHVRNVYARTVNRRTSRHSPERVRALPLMREMSSPRTGEMSSPRSAMAARPAGNKVHRMKDMQLDDIRPMIWSAQVIAPAADADVTVLMRVTYNTLEQICGSLFDSRDAIPAGARLS